MVLFSNKRDYRQAAKEIVQQAYSYSSFEPDLVLFYATLKYNGSFQAMLNIFHKEYGDIPQIGASVDGMIYPEDMHTDGAALVLCRDKNARIHVDGIKEKGALVSSEKLAKRIRCEKGVIVLHFPLVRVPSVLKSAEFFAKGYYYSKRCRSANEKKQREHARKFAEYCDRENIFYLPPTVLNIFAKHTSYKVPIIGINVLHTQVRFNSPHIFCNFEDIGGGIAALIIEKDNINAVYDDIFPDKGSTIEETKRIVRNEFTVIKEFEANFEKNILISLDRKFPVDAVKGQIYVSEEKEDELLGHLDKGDYKVHMPYGILLINKKTNGVFILGTGSYYPFDLFPFFVDVSDYSENVTLGYELVGNKFDAFISCLNNLKYDNKRFVYFCIDVGVVTAFGEKVFEYKDIIKKLVGKNYFGILSTSPSAYIPPEFQLRNYLSEVFNNTFFMSAGTNACVEV